MRSATLSAALALGSLAPAGFAAIVHHLNPPLGEPGHYAWFAEIGVPNWLDITLPAAAQTNAESGSTIAQGLGGVPGGWPDWSVLIGGDSNHPGPWSAFAVAEDDDAFVLALSQGDTLADRRYESWALYALGMPPNVSSLFPEGERRYIGVRTANGRFGWVEVARFGQSLAAFSWAYETEPGVAITAGQVPAPGAAALLALASLRGIRRRRS